MAITVYTAEGRKKAVLGDSTLSAIPACRAYMTSATALPHNTFIVVPLAGEHFDTTGTMHSTTTNTSRIIVPQSGFYLATASLGVSWNTSGWREGYIRLTRPGTGVIASFPRVLFGNGDEGRAVSLNAGLWPCEAGDYFEVLAFQFTSAGTTLNVEECSLSVVWMGDS